MIKKKQLINKISKNLGIIDDVISINFVGSFLNNKNYSDIDIVIITKNISKEIIGRCHDEIKDINYKVFGIKKKIVINDTFGPLKFNTNKNLVFHLMIYSKEDHINHVIKSPFTCYDWERTKASYGLNLKDIYPVIKIFTSDFYFKNRGIGIYRKNLLHRKINYKKYIFKNNKVLTKQLNYKILGKDIYEFCYHVISFTSKNYLKYNLQINKNFTSKHIVNFLYKLFKKDESKKIIRFYKNLIDFKKNKKIKLSQKIAIKNTLNFLNMFENHLKDKEKNCINLNFKRHFKTKYNKSIFLGQKINPPILRKKNFKKKSYHTSFSSPSLRCIQTSQLYSENNFINKNLNEINYGDIEGLTYKNLLFNYPDIIKKWKEKKDIKFPNGETTRNVLSRVLNFINFSKKLQPKKKYLIVTHNVFLRCLLGNYFQLPLSKWHLIKLSYGENLKFTISDKRLFINITRNKFKKLFEKIYENSNSS